MLGDILLVVKFVLTVDYVATEAQALATTGSFLDLCFGLFTDTTVWAVLILVDVAFWVLLPLFHLDMIVIFV